MPLLYDDIFEGICSGIVPFRKKHAFQNTSVCLFTFFDKSRALNNAKKYFIVFYVRGV